MEPQQGDTDCTSQTKSCPRSRGCLFSTSSPSYSLHEPHIPYSTNKPWPSWVPGPLWVPRLLPGWVALLPNSRRWTFQEVRDWGTQRHFIHLKTQNKNRNCRDLERHALTQITILLVPRRSCGLGRQPGISREINYESLRNSTALAVPGPPSQGHGRKGSSGQSRYYLGVVQSYGLVFCFVFNVLRIVYLHF